MTDSTDAGSNAGGVDTPAASPQETLADSYNNASSDSADKPEASADETKQDSNESDQAQDQDSKDTDASESDDRASDGENANDDKDAKKDGESDKDDDAKAEDEKDGSAEAYEDFVIPEGMELDKDALERLTPILKSQNVSQEGAQELIDLYSDLQSKAMKEMTEKHQALVKSWRDETTAEYSADGEQAFKEKISTAQKAINHFCSESERKIISDYGVGNMKGLVAMAYALGSSMSEDSPGDTANAGGAEGEKTLKDVWYPNS